MRAVPRRWIRFTSPARHLAADVSVAALAATYALFSADLGNPWSWVAIALATSGLLIRRPLPWISFAAALPCFAMSISPFAAMIALYSIGRYRKRLGYLITAGAVMFVIQTADLVLLRDGNLVLPFSAWYTSSSFSLLYAIAPSALGVAVRQRIELRQQIQNVTALQREQVRTAAEQALERERAVLAREMHDVVSNQVSLIAVQAGALQVASQDAAAKNVASTIRSLSVATLDELRAMIEVLRAAGGTSRSPAPQPTLEDLPALLANSGITVHTQMNIEQVPPTAVQRAIFRLVQEGLTNARKHAPGADVHLTLRSGGSRIITELTANPPRGLPLDLPSAHHGLIGLRERAELLGGSLSRTLHDDGRHTLTMYLPATNSTGPIAAPSPIAKDHDAQP